jgi:hypothetical protein
VVWDIVATVKVRRTQQPKVKLLPGPKGGDVIKWSSHFPKPNNLTPPQLAERGRDAAAVNHPLEPINGSFTRQTETTNRLPRLV